jgi:hypothetical protein
MVGAVLAQAQDVNLGRSVRLSAWLDIRSLSSSSASIAKRGDRERSLVEEHRNDFAI